MRVFHDLSYHDLEKIVSSIQKFLFVDRGEDGCESWEPDKEWSGADVCEHVAGLLSQYDLVPERQELLPQEQHQYTLDPIDGPTFRQQRELLLRISSLASDGEVYKTSRAEQELLDGLINLTDGIADQAHDKHGIDCLLEVCL